MQTPTCNFASWNIHQVQNPFPNGIKAFQIFSQDKQKLTEYNQALEKTALTAQANGFATDFLYAFLEEPKRYLIVVNNVRKATTRLFANLNECACIETSDFNRFSNDRRETIENLLISNAESYPKENLLRYLGVGTGGCLQDFINIGKLIKAGFQHIEAVLVEPQPYLRFTDMDSTINPIAFLSAVAKERNIKLDVLFVDNVSKTTGLFQIVQLMDFENFESHFNDIMLSFQRLESNGRFYLSFGAYDFIFDTDQCLYKKICNAIDEETDPGNQELLKALAACNLPKPHVAMLTFKFAATIIQQLEIVPKICQASTVKELALTILRPKKFSGGNRYSTSENGYNEEFTTENLSRFLTVLTGKTVRVSFYKHYTEFLNGTLDRPDIITLLFNGGPTALLSNEITRIRQCYEKSRLFFDVSFNSGSTGMQVGWTWKLTEGTTFFGSPPEESRQKVLALMI